MKLVVLIFSFITSVFSFNYIDTIYVSTYAKGLNNGSSWTNAFKTLQAGYNAASDGYLVLCSGVELLTAPVSLNLASNVTFEAVGSNYILNGNNAVVNCISNASAKKITFKKFTFMKAAGDGVNLVTGGDYYSFEKCSARLNLADGWDMKNSNYSNFINCTADSNLGIGINNYGLGTKIMFSRITNNTQGGISNTSLDYLTITNNIIANNGNFGIRCDGINTIKNNVIDNNVTGILFYSNMTSNMNVIVGNRITNNKIGIDFKNANVNMSINYFHNNSISLQNSTLANVDNSNQFNTGYDDGYNNRTDGDYTLKSNAVMGNIEIKIGAE